VLTVKKSQRLPEKLLQQLFTKVAQEWHFGKQAQVKHKHLWCGRHVKVIDGSTVSMPDTPENQKVYPQPNTQVPCCGFPIALHWCFIQSDGVLFSLTTGAAVALVFDVLNTHDVKLARRLYEFIHPNDVLLGDF
jgi:hypothetical protein